MRHSGNDCEEQIIEQAFTREGDTVTMDLGGFEISGTILESSSQMTISSDATAYIPFIQAMYPESEQYLSLLQGATIRLSFKKKKG